MGSQTTVVAAEHHDYIPAACQRAQDVRLGARPESHGVRLCRVSLQTPHSSTHGAKYPEMSRMSWVYPLPAYASVEPFALGTIAIFDVTNPSRAFNVDTCGWFSPSGHSVRYPRAPSGTTVALNTYPPALLGGAHKLSAMLTVISPVNGCPLLRLSKARHGAAG